MSTAPPIDVVPRPRFVDTRGEGPPADTQPRETIVDGLPAEGFELEITDTDVMLRAADENGRRYARATLDQVRQQSGPRLPAIMIRDWPDFAVRGYMLDISRDRVPTRETLERIVEVMGVARLNHLQLYTEHTFAYRDHEVVWRDASPMTPDDVRWLDGLCRSNGIELAANQNCFGHMARWLAHDEYRHRAEVPGGVEVAPGRVMPANTLAPTPDNARFVVDLVEELTSNFTSRSVNIGCDEPLELGKGVSKPDVESRGMGAVYAEHVARIARPLVEGGHDVLFWDDMMRKHPEGLAVLPEGTTALAWWYSAPADAPAPGSDGLEHFPREVRDALTKMGLDLEAMASWAPGFSVITQPLVDAGFPFWVAPGTSSWQSLIGRVEECRANLLDAAQVGVDRGARGYLITEWGDNGHLNPPSVSFGPLIYGGAVSWCAAANRDLDVRPALDRLVFADDSNMMGTLLDDIGHLSDQTGFRALGGTDLFIGLGRAAVSGDGDARKTAAVVDGLGDALASLDKTSPQCADAEIVKQELRAVIRLARVGAWRLLERAGGTAPPLDQVRAEFGDAIAAQRASWLLRSRPGGLDDSLRALERSHERLGE